MRDVRDLQAYGLGTEISGNSMLKGWFGWVFCMRGLFGAFVLSSMLLVAAANIWRNRDPYPAYLLRGADGYLTTHLIKYETWEGTSLPYRLRSMPEHLIPRILGILYGGCGIVLDGGGGLNDSPADIWGGMEVTVTGDRFMLPPSAVEPLLRWARYSVLFSPAAVGVEGRAPWWLDADGDFLPLDMSGSPLMLVFLPRSRGSKAQDVNVVGAGKYVFFIPSLHPAMEYVDVID